MLIHEASRETGLTKKAIEYYAEQGLISPAILENGYRDFVTETIERLRKISVLRKLGLGTDDIRAVLGDETGDLLQKLSVQKELRMRAEGERKRLLDELSRGASYPDIAERLLSADRNAAVAEKLLEAFPGYYGRFVCLHFARFLNEPIASPRQRAAYEKVLSFLDNVPPLDFPQELQEYLVEGTRHIDAGRIVSMTEDVQRSVENPEDFIEKNMEALAQYLAYRRSDAYRDSPMFRMQALTKEFYGASGYYDTFIPAMKELSPAYAQYHAQIELANEIFLARFPESRELL